MQILLLNQTFHPDVVSTAQHLTDLAVRLAERGHKVSVVASRRGYDDAAQSFPHRETWRGITIYRVGSTKFGKGAKWRRAADFASFTASCCLRLARLPRHDVVVALTSPPMIAFIGAALASAWRSKFFYLVMDLNPDEAIVAGWLRPDSFATKLLNGMSRFSLRRAHKVFALDRFMRDRIIAKGIRADRIAVIPPWSHDDAIRYDATGRERFREEHGLQGKFVVMYSGNHSPCHPLDSLIEAARRMTAQARIAFCFVGGGSEFAKVQQFAEQHRLQNVVCLPYRPLDQLAASLSAADLHVVVMGEAFVGVVHPCKIYNILAIGIPFLCIGPKPSHLSEILDSLPADSRCAWAKHGDVDGIVRQIQAASLAGDRREYDSFQEAAARFGKESLLPKLVDQLEAGCRADAHEKSHQALVAPDVRDA
jgi:glycosyltransferase involved in cell wall biosynthesis